MFSDSDWVKILNKLRQLTELGKIKWSENGRGDIYAEIGDVLYLIESKDHDGVAPWVLFVRKGSDNEWSELGSLLSIGGVEIEDEPGTKIGPLREIAFRQATNADEIVSDLLASMNEIEPQSPPTYGAPF